MRYPSRLLLYALFCSFFFAPPLHAKTVEYEFDIAEQNVNFTGKPNWAMTVGGQIPGPTMEFTEGDTLVVTFHNKMKMDSSIHWHGVLLPADQDGVPYINTLPIPPGGSHTYTFPIIQAGTYWYHAHSNLEEQKAVYGALVFHPKKESRKFDREAVVVLSEWTDEDPMKILSHLKKDGDWYSLKKGTVQSWYGVIKNHAVRDRLKNSWHRMPPMDISDVGYDRFLMNGQVQASLGPTHPGEKILLRVINAGASDYFNIEFAGGDMEVVAADGQDVVPFKAKRILMGMAETYDVIVTIPDDKSYEFRATAQDGTGHSSGILGNAAEFVKAPDIRKPNLYKMEGMGGMSDMGGMDHSHHAMPESVPRDSDSYLMEDYSRLRAPAPTTLPLQDSEREVVLTLTGYMDGYVWTFDNKTLTEVDKIRIRKGENVKFVFINKTMMWHPLHLHGHFFRVLNGQGESSPLKHTVNIPPLARVEIEFLADQEKDWFFHCHNLYHMMTGMARVVHYQGTERSKKLIEAEKTSKEMQDDDFFFVGNLATQSNMMEGFLSGFNTRNAFQIQFEYNYRKGYQVTPVYQRRLTQYFSFILGGNFEKDDMEDGNVGIIGVRWMLPLFIESELRYDTQGQLRLTLESEVQLTSRLLFDWDFELAFETIHPQVKTDYHLELEYRFTKFFSLVANYDSEYNFGGGVMWRF